MAKALIKKVEVLAFVSRPFTGKDGREGKVREMTIRSDGEVFKLKVEKSLTDAQAEAMIDKTVDLELVLSTFGDSVKPDFRVVGSLVK